MSRKKSPKSKGGTSAPSSALPAAQQHADAGGRGAARAKGAAGAASASSSSCCAANGVALPSRPSLSNSREFYDVAFKARSQNPVEL